jgi:long-chain acyl-CoA synthetase
MDFRRLFDIFHYQQARYPQKVALAHRVDHHWNTFSTQECITWINKISAGLLQLGLKKGDKAALIADTGSAWWNFLDIAMLQIGVVVVPLHDTTHPRDLEFILKDADVKYCFASSRQLYERILEVQPETPTLKKVFTFEKYPDLPSLQDILVEPDERHLSSFQTFKAVIHEDDLATIIYTSGTTGTPKGVMLSHKNIISNIKSIISLIPVNCDKTTFSFLPLSHVFERMVTYTYMAVGASLYYSESGERMIEDLQDVRPHYFTAVPRVLERLYDRILAEGQKRTRLKRRLLRWALRLGERYREHKVPSLLYWIQLRLASILVFHSWRRLLGNRVQGIVVGAAALQEKLARIFSAAGLEIREGYGLTETSPVVAFNHFGPGMYKFGTVGLPVPGVEVKIDQPNEKGEGEILVKGPNIMLGYHQQPGETEKVIDEQGWFHTGDIGLFVQKRFLKVTGRKKDIFKTSSGKYVAPQYVEQQLRHSPFIDQCLVIGFQKPFVAALIVPQMEQLKSWCLRNNVHWTAPPYMVLNPKVESLFEDLVEQINQSLDSHERIQKFLLLPESWTIENGEMTPTLKLRRQVIEEKQAEAIEKLYASK